MFNSVKLSARLVAAAMGAMTIGAIAFTSSAAAAPLPLFPFFGAAAAAPRRSAARTVG